MFSTIARSVGHRIGPVHRPTGVGVEDPAYVYRADGSPDAGDGIVLMISKGAVRSGSDCINVAVPGSVTLRSNALDFVDGVPSYLNTVPRIRKAWCRLSAPDDRC